MVALEQSEALQWQVLDVEYEGFHPVRHVVPLNDMKDHDKKIETRREEYRSTCWCKPFIEDGIIAHNSMDGRENFEPDNVASTVRHPS